MSLHDRIMNEADNHGLDTDHGCGYVDGMTRAATLATEADDLIGWCEAHFETLMQLADSAASFDEANIAIDRIKKHRDSTK